MDQKALDFCLGFKFRPLPGVDRAPRLPRVALGARRATTAVNTHPPKIPNISGQKPHARRLDYKFPPTQVAQTDAKDGRALRRWSAASARRQTSTEENDRGAANRQKRTRTQEEAGSNKRTRPDKRARRSTTDRKQDKGNNKTQANRNKQTRRSSKARSSSKARRTHRPGRAGRAGPTDRAPMTGGATHRAASGAAQRTTRTDSPKEIAFLNPSQCDQSGPWPGEGFDWN